MILNGEYVKKWKEVIMVYLKTPSQNLPAETEGNHEKHKLG
jgi:hypothetical protein